MRIGPKSNDTDIGQKAMWRWRQTAAVEPRTKERLKLLEAGGGREWTDASFVSWGRESPEDTLITASSSQNCERMNFYCFKTPSLCQLVTVALGK